MANTQETSWVKGNSTIKIGAFTYGHRRIKISEWGEGANLNIGKFCSIAGGVEVMLGGNHRVDWATTFPFGHIHQEVLGGNEISGHPTTKGDVFIGNDVWIGSGSTIMSGISIGDGAVVAANSTVGKDVTAYTIVGGNPARPLKQRFSAEIIELLVALRWWDLDLSDIKKVAPELSQTPTVEKIMALLVEHRPSHPLAEGRHH